MKVISEKEFNSIKNSNKTLLVSFCADWCGPCRSLVPVMESFSENNKDIEVCKIDVDKSREFAKSLNISSLPTIVLFEDGKEIARHKGLIDEEELEEFVKDKKNT